MPQLPTGTVTFVFSDIEGSTRLLQRLGDEGYAALLATHRRLVRETFAEQGGQEIDTQGDAFFYSFARARAAVAAAVAVQRAHAAHEWPDALTVRVRLGLHTGEPAVGDEGYTGLDVVRASRIAATGRGGQVLLSETTRAIVASDLPPGVELRPLGERQLKDIERPETLYELAIADLPAPTSEPSREATPPALTGDVLDQAFEREGVPAWVRNTARRFVPQNLAVGGESQRLIEERVMGELERSFREREEARQQKRLARKRGSRRTDAPPIPSAGRRPSVADEIARLRDLRDAGALTDEQYERAVERAIEGSR